MRDCSWEAVEDEAAQLESARVSCHSIPVHAYPFLHSWLFSNSWSIMFTMISSDTRPPWSMIFFACRPSSVFLVTCARSMSPVACTARQLDRMTNTSLLKDARTRWQTQYLSFILGACVPLPTSTNQHSVPPSLAPQEYVPAPGGPIKIILMPSLAPTPEPPAARPCIFASSSCTRASSLLIVPWSWSTSESVGAIANQMRSWRWA